MYCIFKKLISRYDDNKLFDTTYICSKNYIQCTVLDNLLFDVNNC